MEGLTFKKLNKYQTLVSSENHQVVLTDMIKKYSHFLMKAQIHAVVSMILGATSAFFVALYIHRALVSFPDFTEVLIILVAGLITSVCVSTFNTSRCDISRFKQFIRTYRK